MTGWIYERKVVGSIPGPDRVCVLEQDTLFHIVPVHSAEAENEYQQKLGVNLAIDRRPIQGGGVLHSQLLNATETGISSGLMSRKARDRLLHFLTFVTGYKNKLLKLTMFYNGSSVAQLT